MSWSTPTSSGQRPRGPTPRRGIHERRPKPCIHTLESAPLDSYTKHEFSVTQSLYWVTLLCVCGCLWGSVQTSLTQKPKEVHIETLKAQFSHQNLELWASLEAGVNDVVRRHRPSSFILLYKEDAQKTMNKLVEKVAQYATCTITDCSKSPIVLTDKMLNSQEILDDYGIIIDRYKDSLEESGVMIVANLENVRGTSAQAFHSICDEYNPLVDESLIIFTMKVDAFTENSMKFVENYFSKKWNDIKEDAYIALITRISSMILEINAENL